MVPVVNEWMEQVVMEDDWWEALLTNSRFKAGSTWSYG